MLVVGACDPVELLPVERVGVLLVDRLGSLVVGVGVSVGAGLLRTGTVDLVGATLVVVLVETGVLVETLGLFAGAVSFTTLAVVLPFALGLGFVAVGGGVFAFAGAGLAAAFCAGAGGAGVGVD